MSTALSLIFFLSIIVAVPGSEYARGEQAGRLSQSGAGDWSSRLSSASPVPGWDPISEWSGSVLLPSEAGDPLLAGLPTIQAGYQSFNSDRIEYGIRFLASPTAPANGANPELRFSGSPGREAFADDDLPDGWLCDGVADPRKDFYHCVADRTPYSGEYFRPVRVARDLHIWHRNDAPVSKDWSWRVMWYSPDDDVTYEMLLARGADWFGATTPNTSEKIPNELLTIVDSLVPVSMGNSGGAPAAQVDMPGCAIADLLPAAIYGQSGGAPLRPADDPFGISEVYAVPPRSDGSDPIVIRCNPETAGYRVDLNLAWGGSSAQRAAGYAVSWLNSQGVADTDSIAIYALCPDRSDQAKTTESDCFGN